jgi:hypothetical protein
MSSLCPRAIAVSSSTRTRSFVRPARICADWLTGKENSGRVLAVAKYSLPYAVSISEVFVELAVRDGVHVIPLVHTTCMNQRPPFGNVEDVDFNGSYLRRCGDGFRKPISTSPENLPLKSMSLLPIIVRLLEGRAMDFSSQELLQEIERSSSP